MRDLARKSILPFARSARLDSLIRWSGQFTIFPFYHTVSEKHSPHTEHLYATRSLQEFEKDLEQLLKWFEPVSLGDFLEQPDDGNGKQRMVLSFDDGLKECHQYIAPMLKKRGIPALFFLNNRFIDNGGLFYRYKASLLINLVRKDGKAGLKVADFLKIRNDQIEKTILMIGYQQLALLDEMAEKVELDFSVYLRERPVYLDTSEVKELLKWGFDIGGHSFDHVDFTNLDAEGMIHQVRESMDDLQKRFGISSRYFSFPFTSDGVPREVINRLLEEGIAQVLMGTAGLKKTDQAGFIQRIPMEDMELPALEVLKIEYLYYLLKMPLGRNRLRY